MFHVELALLAYLESSSSNVVLDLPQIFLVFCFVKHNHIVNVAKHPFAAHSPKDSEGGVGLRHILRNRKSPSCVTNVVRSRLSVAT